MITVGELGVKPRRAGNRVRQIPAVAPADLHRLAAGDRRSPGGARLDRRRFRPNLILGGVPEFAERGWEGKTLAVGEALIRIATLRQRCIMVTFDPDTASQDVEVLLRIHRELGGTFALDAEVIRPGRIRVGDPAEILAQVPARRARAIRAGEP
jgi:uncharacterized protein YcbX